MYEKQMFEEDKINRVKHDTQMYWLSESIPNKESLEKNPLTEKISLKVPSELNSKVKFFINKSSQEKIFSEANPFRREFPSDVKSHQKRRGTLNF